MSGKLTTNELRLLRNPPIVQNAVPAHTDLSRLIERGLLCSAGTTVVHLEYHHLDTTPAGRAALEAQEQR